MAPTSLDAEAATMATPWSPRLLAELNGQHVKLARMEGAFDWHAHPEADELFLVVEGEIRVEFRDGAVELTEDDLHVVPAGVEHRPVADETAFVLLFEPAGTRNTGDRVTDRTTEVERR
ncbi:cupin domain-containing protein [Halomarina oriensis]|uniref:Cupin domain-containing protein n=1 Tax=Halomarina oriensis TaxID=671145 RepID=A0A6B0GKA8_9EURY|nr:cupin domain-containing protein [Halomarina oriensis]MWG34247.1 cupin domain-containing protein [Halomarina oriensis]